MPRHLALALALLAACHAAPAPVAPAAPLPAAPAPTLATTAEECQAVLDALAAHARCPALTNAEQQELHAWRDHAAIDLAAGQDPRIDAATSRRIAHACHDAAAAVRDAATRCGNAPPAKE